jgi:hypothetical protein
VTLNGKRVLTVPATPIVKEFYEYICKETIGNVPVDIDENVAIGEQVLAIANAGEISEGKTLFEELALQ